MSVAGFLVLDWVCGRADCPSVWLYVQKYFKAACCAEPPCGLFMVFSDKVKLKKRNRIRMWWLHSGCV